MRVCLLGDFDPTPDEGLKNLAGGLARALEGKVDLVRVDVNASPVRVVAREVRRARPDVIHMVPGPTLKGMALLRSLKAATGARTVMSAPRPRIGLPWRLAVAPVRPDLVLAQSLRSERFFQGLGCRTAYLPAGVDTDRFAPLSTRARAEARHAHGIPEDAYVALHVGHLRPSRRLDVLQALPRDGVEVLVVASTYLGVDESIRRALEAAGCRLLLGYVPDLPRVYGMADCYAWTPGLDDSLELPLSVLEAMSAGLAVVSTPFPGLVHAFPPDAALRYAQRPEDVPGLVREMAKERSAGGNREKILPWSWERVGDRLVREYASLGVRA